jgi:hypothetical protein
MTHIPDQPGDEFRFYDSAEQLCWLPNRILELFAD